MDPASVHRATFNCNLKGRFVTIQEHFISKNFKKISAREIINFTSQPPTLPMQKGCQILPPFCDVCDKADYGKTFSRRLLLALGRCTHPKSGQNNFLQFSTFRHF